MSPPLVSRLGVDKTLRKDTARTADEVNQRDIPYTTMPCSAAKTQEREEEGFSSVVTVFV